MQSDVPETIWSMVAVVWTALAGLWGCRPRQPVLRRANVEPVISSAYAWTGQRLGLAVFRFQFDVLLGCNPLRTVSNPAPPGVPTLSISSNIAVPTARAMIGGHSNP